LTISSLKETLTLLNHDFDYWWGESTVNDEDNGQYAIEAGGSVSMASTIHYTANPLFKGASPSSMADGEEREGGRPEEESGDPETTSENDPLLSRRLNGLELREARMEQQIAALLGKVLSLEKKGASGRPTPSMPSSGGGNDGAKRASLLISNKGPTDFVRRPSGIIEAVSTVMPSISGSGGERGSGDGAGRGKTLVQQVPAADIMPEV
jgi:hypothetical protein